MEFSYVYLVIIASAFVIVTYLLWSINNELDRMRIIIDFQGGQISNLYSRVYELEDKLSLTEAVKVKYE